MMHKQEKQALLPKLRFPEFREAREWEEKPLAKVCNVLQGYGFPEVLQGKSKGKYPFCKVSDVSRAVAENGGLLTEAINCVGDAELLKLRAKLIPKGATVFAKIGEALRLNRRAYVQKECLIDNNFTGLKAIDEIANAYFVYLLSQLIDLNKHCGGAVPSVNKSTLEEIEVVIPGPDEKKRIADCLASLDELITLEAQKLDTLKTHKQGLMQQLFPAEGETLPTLRFPEFRDAGEWEERRLGDVGSVRMCKRILKEQTSPHGDIPFYKIGTFGGVPDAYISREIYEKFRDSYPFPKNGAVLISAAGTIGRAVRYNGELAYFQDSNIVWLDNSEKLIGDNFLFFLYQLIDWSPSVGAIQRLYNENILGAQVKFPSIPEQQKITDCLTSLDDLITAQTQKLAALKIHKKALMQQLFPALSEVQG
ncbi:MAG: restriction endonuclease subunit S [Trichloromonadaceae bacterium]